MSTYTEDYLVEQPAIQLMQHELGWDVKVGILNVGFSILNGRRRSKIPWLNPCHLALSLAERTGRSAITAVRAVGFLFALEPDRQCNRLKIKEFLFEWKTSP